MRVSSPSAATTAGLAGGTPAMDELKLWIWSDLHLEIDPWWFPEDPPEADVAVIAGDVHRATETIGWLVRQLDAGVMKVRRVIYVPGNHDFYWREMGEALREARDAARTFGIDLLDMDEVVIEGVRFLGGTLWTDYALDGDVAGAMEAARALKDHKAIHLHRDGRTRPFEPEDARAMHLACVAWFRDRLSTPHPGPTVCVSHHGVSRMSVGERWEADPATAAFASDLMGLIDGHQPELWCHGHTHESHDYRLGRTRVVCNPKGYGTAGMEENKLFDPRLVVAVPKGPAARDG
jgi:hypothetical protein